MSMNQPSAGELRENIRFEQKVFGPNIGGVKSQAWAAVIPTQRAKVNPTRGGEEVIAGRMEGKTSYDIWVRSSTATRALTNKNRAVNNRTGEVYTLGQPIDPFGRNQWLLIQATSGGDADQG